MDRRIESYLYRIERKLPKAIAADSTQEIRAHLTESVADCMALGLNEEAASLEALRRIGSDKAIVEGLLRAHRGLDEKSIWRLSCFLVVLPAIYLCST